MALLEGKTPKERKQLILAIVLGTVALSFLGYMFLFASSGGGSTTAARPTFKSPKTAQTPSTGTQIAPSPDPQIDTPPQPLNINWTMPDAPTATRNIFAYFIPPPPTVKAIPKASASLTPTPAPTPPWILAGINPSNVTARTSDFTLEVSGDKFTPAAHIYIDNQELPTQVSSDKRVTANVPAAFIASPGARQVAVRSSDGQLFSNTATLNITAPPVPQYTYIGLLGRRPGSRGGKDTAMLKKLGSTGNNADDIISVPLGGTIQDGRFRVTSLNERSIEFTDTQLNIKHTIDYTAPGEGGNSFNNQRGRNPRIIAPGAIQPVDSDEP